MVYVPMTMLEVSPDIHKCSIYTVRDSHDMVTGSQYMITGSQDMFTGSQDVLQASKTCYQDTGYGKHHDHVHHQVSRCTLRCFLIMVRVSQDLETGS
jgi:hypothetical protein